MGAQIYKNKKRIWMFLAPAFAFMVVYLYYPFIQNILNSFMHIKYMGTAGGEWNTPWYKNYLALMSDPKMKIALKNTVIMRSFASLASYTFTCVILDNYSNGRIIVTCIYTFIVTVSASIFARLICNGKWTFRIQDDPSELSNINKLKMLFTNTSITIWLVAVLAMYFLTVRFV